MKISCEYKNIRFEDNNTFYGCYIYDHKIPLKANFKITGQHKGSKQHKDILFVYIMDCTVANIPQGFTRHFPNLKALLIESTNLKNISRNDLIEYKNLEKIIFRLNWIEYVPGDLLNDFKNLKYINIVDRNLKLVEPNILDGHDNLSCVHFGINQRYDLYFSDFPSKHPIKPLTNIKNALKEKFTKYASSSGKKNSKAMQQRQLLIIRQQSESEPQQQKQVPNPQKGMITKLLAFIQDESTKDFKIIINDREFPVHKFQLASRSPTLAELFKANPKVENLNLIDISVETFEIILKFLYTDELPGDDGANFLHLFTAVDKLKIVDLMEFTATKLIYEVNQKNALTMFKLSHTHGYEELKQKSFNEVKKKYSKINFNDKWIDDIKLMIEIIANYEKKEAEIEKLQLDFQKFMQDKLDLKVKEENFHGAGFQH
ncbi:hypothetical protein ACKWTF_015217 [Chironomus riparius]